MIKNKHDGDSKEIPIQERTFISPTNGELTLPQVIEAIVQFVDGDHQSRYKVVIGTDSQAKRINGDAEIEVRSTRHL